MAFVSGVFTILAPSIWPLLPIILSTSATEQGTHRPLLVTVGILASFIIFTTSVSLLTQHFQINHTLFKVAAVIALCYIGTSLLWPRLNRWTMRVIHKVAFFTSRNDEDWDNGYLGDILTGMMLGLIWSPFSGTILEPIAELVNRENFGWSVLMVNLMYVAGIGLPLFVIARGGEWLIKMTQSRGKYYRQGQIFFGCTTLLTAVSIATGLDIVLQKMISDWMPYI
jgi:cytochrome c biogenesis protein CcdA